MKQSSYSSGIHENRNQLLRLPPNHNFGPWGCKKYTSNATQETNPDSRVIESLGILAHLLRMVRKPKYRLIEEVINKTPQSSSDKVILRDLWESNHHDPLLIPLFLKGSRVAWVSPPPISKVLVLQHGALHENHAWPSRRGRGVPTRSSPPGFQKRGVNRWSLIPCLRTNNASRIRIIIKSYLII